MVVTKLDLLRIVDQIGEKALGCVALRKGVRRALLELRPYRYQRRAAARRERAIRRLDLAKRTQSGWRGLLLRLGSLGTAKRAASSLSTRTAADPAFGFGSRQSRGGENRRRGFCETNPISSAAIEARLRAIVEGESAKRG